MDIYTGMEYVYTVYRERSFTKAAKKLFISQPSLSASVRHLEEKLGYPIFDRATKPISLTAYGVKYIETIEKIMVLEDEFTDYLEDMENLRIGNISLGGCSLYTSWVLPPIMNRFKQKYPSISLSLTEEKSSRLTTMIQNDEIDIIIDNHSLNNNEFEHTFFKKEHLLLCVPRSNPVNEQLAAYQLTAGDVWDRKYMDSAVPAVPIQSFADSQFILMKPQNQTRIMADRIFAANKIQPKVAFELDQQMTAYNVAVQGLGIAFVSDTLVNSVQDSRRVVFYKIDQHYACRDLNFYWKAGRYVTRAMKEFMKTAQEVGTPD